MTDRRKMVLCTNDFGNFTYHAFDVWDRVTRLMNIAPKYLTEDDKKFLSAFSEAVKNLEANHTL